MLGLGFWRAVGGKSTPSSEIVHRPPNEFFYTETDPGKPNGGEDRFWLVGHCADLRPTDSVLDVGCAEGVITRRIALKVARVDAFDYSDKRIEYAKAAAEKDGIGNINYWPQDLHDFTAEPLSYDVTVFMSVYNILTKRGRVGVDHLRGLARATRRQLIMRVNVQDAPEACGALKEIFDCLVEEGFAPVCFPRDGKYDNVIIANRRGTDGRLGATHQLVLVPVEHTKDIPDLSNLPQVEWRVYEPR